MNPSHEIAIFASGCFWCTEAVFKRLKGVMKVTSGYAGGGLESPSYEAVSTGTTGHAESVQIEFDPAVISYERLLDVFFATHDPTTPNRQGADVGEQYRSVIFYHTNEQQRVAEKAKARLMNDRVYQKPIVTEIVPVTTFFAAEGHHQDYYAKNSSEMYCQVVINPKLAKLRQKFAPFLKDDA